MKVNLPYSKSKRYLTGIDWAIAALNDMNRRSTGGTNDSQLVLELDGPFDVEHFRAAMTKFARLFPMLGGTPARDWNLAPYWKMPRPGHVPTVSVEEESVSGTDLFAALTRTANAGFHDPRTHLAFRVFKVDGRRHVVTLHFDHCLFDAHGAEAFMELFHRWERGEDCSARLAAIALTEPAHLCDWKRKFEAGKLLVRMLRRFAETLIVTFPRPRPLQGRPFKFALLEFGEPESKAVIDRAYRDAGFLMFMPYVLATVVQALDAVRRRKNVAGRDYLVSVSVDLRTPGTAAARLFFNHVSFMFFGVPVTAAADRRQVTDTVKAQMYEQIKSGFPQAMADSSLLMRILPVSVLGRLMRRPLRGEFASLGFTCVGKGGYVPATFMETRVANLYHMPLVPVPPGLGLVVNQYGDRMNVVLTYLDGLLDDEEVQGLMADVRQGL
jgi:hypothetical protein